MNFAKARWTANGDTIQLGVEFSKVNKQKRLVSGWATLDNVDTEGDLVTAEASLDAFARARGNLREMHKKDSAVGKVVSFKEKSFTAPDGQTYRGIFVTARVSEGAEDTWLKVLDGTLSGFSIGGAIVESQEDWVKDGSEKIRKVTKYDLTELSLVDNPGNQYADVIRFQKSVDGSVTSVSGMVEEQRILNVFFCDEDEISFNSPDEVLECEVCHENMKCIGFIEDFGDNQKKVNELITKYLSHDTYHEGGVEMTKEIEFTGVLSKSAVVPEEEDESVATGHEAGDPQEVPTPAEDATVEEEVSPVHDESDEIAKQIDGLKDSIRDILNDNKAETAQKIEALEKTIKQTQDVLEKRINEVDTKLKELDTDLGKARTNIQGLEKTINKINSGSALKKSADLDTSTEPEQNEDPWANSAFSVRGITNNW
jgi:hypothetical protein